MADSGINWLEGIKLFGGFAGLAAFSWQLYQAFRSYLQLDLTIQDAGTLAIAEASIENKSITGKTLDYALLLVGPELEDPVKTARALASSLGSPDGGTLQIDETDDIIDLRRLLPDERPHYTDRSRAVLPLPFFYREQEDIGDERLKYRCSIDRGQFNEGTYSVRFFLFPKKKEAVRSTHSLFYVAGSVGKSVA